MKSLVSLKKKDQFTEDLIAEHGTNWFVKTILNDDINLLFKNFFINFKDCFVIKNEGYTTTGDATQYWVYNKNYKNKIIHPKILSSSDWNSILSNTTNIIKNKLSFLKLFQEKNNQKNPQLFLNTMWYVEGNEGSYQTIHDHDNNDNGVYSGEGISALFYIDVEGVGTKGEGNFYVVMNSNKRSIYDSSPKYIEIMPSKNDFLIFPVNLLHGTYPQKKGKRIIVNLNFEVIFPLEEQKVKFDYNYEQR